MSIVNPEPANTGRVAPKVTWATVGAYLAGVIALALVNAFDADSTLLTDAIPDMYEPFVMPLVPALIAFVSGYVAKHQWRVVQRNDGSTPVG